MYDGHYVETMALDADYDPETETFSTKDEEGNILQADIIANLGNLRGEYRRLYQEWMNDEYDGEPFAEVDSEGDWKEDQCGVFIDCEDVDMSGVTDYPDTEAWQEENTFPDEYPVLDPITPSSHGDPIVWTFNGEMYDLDVDGHYLSSSHQTKFDHEVHISVYNHYMREIQVTNKETGDIMLSINNLGDVVNKAYPYYFKSDMKKCQYEDECDFFYKEYVFDAQEFEYVVQIHPHSYEDQALKEGETGLHIDVYPHAYPGYKFADYDGLYFSNPLAEVCESH